jgi:hypothetical protein
VNLDLQQDICKLLSELKVVQGSSHDTISPPADCLMETICAWVAAGKESDVDVLAHLFQLQNSIRGIPLSVEVTNMLAVDDLCQCSCVHSPA